MTTRGQAAELALLTQALDVPATDVGETLARLSADARSAVQSYLGLSVSITVDRAHFGVTVLTEGSQAADVRTSLLIPLSLPTAGASVTPALSDLVLYAATPGAFIDLAADLAWITGRARTEFRVDRHCTPPPEFATSTQVGTMSSINQALGVLIGRGAAPEQAERGLYARATTAGIELLGAANLILDALQTDPPES